MVHPLGGEEGEESPGLQGPKASLSGTNPERLNAGQVGRAVLVVRRQSIQCIKEAQKVRVGQFHGGCVCHGITPIGGDTGIAPVKDTLSARSHCTDSKSVLRVHRAVGVHRTPAPLDCL